MIAKITRGSRPGDLAVYLHGPGRLGEHVYDGRTGGAVIAGNLGREGARDGAGWAADLREAAAVRPEIVRPVWHMSLRCAPGDRVLSDVEWAGAVHQVATDMGFADRPHVVVRHGDDHVHVVVCRVGHDGSVWHARNDRRSAQEARRGVEARYGLAPAPVRSTASTRRVPDHQVTSGEHRRATRQGHAPARVALAGRVRVAADAARGQGRAGFESALKVAGVQYRANVARTGRVSGYSFTLPGHTDTTGTPVWWKASDLDKALSWKHLEAVLTAPEAPPDVQVPRRRLEPATRHAARLAEATERAATDARAARGAAIAPTVRAQQDAADTWWDARHQDEATRAATGAARITAEHAADARTAHLRARIAQVTNDPTRAAQLEALAHTHPEALDAVLTTHATHAGRPPTSTRTRPPSTPAPDYHDRTRHQQHGRDHGHSR